MDLTQILYSRWMIIKEDQFKLVGIEVIAWASESVLFSALEFEKSFFHVTWGKLMIQILINCYILYVR